ncbi:amino acid adenylation domain-containing protein [Amycolatopsis keratiniphila]|uniref:Phenyloxazoline synthase MbtB n=1 Tax=Amycolatopsis keratiniphila TaxID=129921 RepID=R4TBX7_9PSEU|nr:amino acid adenylation domain-containing protein [Amycolatopsis keratiniphila]
MLLAAFATTLFRYTESTDLVFGAPGRAYRVKVDGDPAFAELVARVAAEVSFVDEKLPVVPAAELLNVWQGTEKSIPFVAGFARDVGEVDAAVTLVWRDGGAELVYREGAAGAANMARHLATVLDTAAPERRMSEVDLMTADERHRVVVAANDTGVAFDGARTLSTRIAEFALTTPHAPAVVDPVRRLDFAGLDAAANRLARHLVDHGVRPADRVGVLLERGVDAVVAQLAVHRAQAAAVLLDPALPTGRLRFMLADAAVVVVLTHSAHAAVPETGTVIELDRDRELIGRASAGLPSGPAGPDDISHVVYTSGSTGKPKAVLQRHRAVANLIDWAARAYAPRAGDRASWVSAPGFAVGLMEWMPFLGNGVPVYIAADATTRSPHELRDWLVSSAITHAVVVTTMAERVWSLPWPETAPLRCLIVTGEPVRRWPPADLPFDIIVSYGSTETTNVASCYHAGRGIRLTSATVDPVDRKGLPPVGLPIDNVRTYLLDPRGEPVPDGVIGELYVAGAGLSAGYLGRQTETAAKYVRSPVPEEPDRTVVRTGDLGRRGVGGALEIVGRADAQVKVRGFRVELGEVENALRERTSAQEAAVVAIGDDQPRIVAYVTGTAEPAADLHGKLAEFLPHYMLPAAYVRLGELPKLPNGKLDRANLPAPSTAESAVGPDHVEPRTETERALADLWRELLGLDRVGSGDDFFKVGGHSMAAVDLVARIEHRFGVVISLAALQAAPTVAGIAALIEDGGADPFAALPALVPDPARAHEPFPLTDTQHAYWIGRGDAVELGGVGCHGYFEWESTDLDVDRFRHAWWRLVERHSALRTIIRPDGTQEVLTALPDHDIAVLDLTGEPDDVVEERLDSLRELLSHQVFPADRWPLFDVRLTLLPGGVVRLHLGFDLLITDAWSYFQILVPDLVLLYDQHENELEPLELTFRDYVLAAEVELERSPVYRRARDYWLRRLDTLPPAPDLPKVAKAASRGPVRFHRRAHQLAPERWNELKKRARERSITPTCLLVAVFAEVLRTWSANERFTINFPLFNRLALHPQVKRIVGDFTTTSLLAVDKVDGTFAERATALQRRMWTDLEHRHFGGVRVLRELARRGDSGVRAAFPVVVTSLLGHPPRHTSASFGEAIYTISQTPQVSLDFQIFEVAGELRFNWDSLDALFPEGVLDDMFGAYRRLLERLADDERSWDTEWFDLVPAHQREVWREVNDTAAPAPTALLHAAVAEHAATDPGRPAVVAVDRTLTYGELDAEVNRVGRRLRDLGARPGELVGVVLEKGWEQIVAVHGVLASGAGYLPIDPGVPAERLRHLLDDGQVRFVLTSRVLDGGLDWPGAVRRLVVDSDFADVDAGPLPPVQRPSDLAYVIHTSGSTGVPKGVMVDHQGAMNTIADINARFDIGPADRCLAVSGLHFDLSVYDVFGMIAAGGTVVVPPPSATPSPAVWADLVVEHGVTFWNSVPQLAELCVLDVEGRGEGLGDTLRLVVLAGDWIPLSLPDQIRAVAPSADVIGSGGPTETCIWSVIQPIGTVDPEWPSIPYGKPMTNQRHHVLDAQGRPRPFWVPGEIHTASEVGLALGYWRDEELTAQRFAPLPGSGDRAYATGDLGRYLPDGTIEILGRVDLQVKIQGNRVELGEIEAVLTRHPAVRAAAVVAAGPSHGAKTLRAFVVPQPGSAPAELDLRTHLADRMPGYLVPASITVVDSLPLTGNGKVDRAALTDRSTDTAVGRLRKTPPSTDLERVVCAVWADVLGLDEVGVDDGFFALGGDSLNATKVVSRIRELFEIELPIRVVLESPTVAELCAEMTEDPAKADEVAELAGLLCGLSASLVDDLLAELESAS